MSISNRDHEENQRATRNGKWRQKSTFAAEYLAQTSGGEPKDYMGNASFPEWNDKTLVEAGYLRAAVYQYHVPAPPNAVRPQTLMYEVLRYEHNLIPGEKRFTQRMPTGVED